jgi:hypothetical protein
MVVVLDLKGSNAWLSCSVQVAFKFFWQWEGSLMAFPKPLPGRTPRVAADSKPGCLGWAVVKPY